MEIIRESPGWRDHDFRLPEIAKFIAVPATTVDAWLSTARAQGYPPGVTAGRFRWLCAGHVYACALLAKLHAIGHPVTPAVIFAAFDFAASPPKYGKTWTVADADGALVTVNAWLCFVAVRAWVEREAVNA